MRISDPRGWGVVGVLLATTLPAGAAPSRVVSMNLCTDQMAMLLAAPGQLISVSDLAGDPRMSPMADEAKAYAVNHGRAEEIYLMRPDLVIAGAYTSGPTVAMLRRLGIRVEIMPPAESFKTIAQQITETGTLLGQEPAAARLRAEFEAGLAGLGQDNPQGRAALYYANGYTSGGDTLAGAIVEAAGYTNIAAEYGVSNTRPLPLELLVMSDPDRVITGAKWPGQSRSEEILDHPALGIVSAERGATTTRDWICGTPNVLKAIEALE